METPCSFRKPRTPSSSSSLEKSTEKASSPSSPPNIQTLKLPFPSSSFAMDSSYDQSRGSFNRHDFDFNSRIMLTAIVSLSLVIILVVALHIYARCFLRRNSRRRNGANINQLVPTGGVNSREPPKIGLDPMIIASLPIFVFKQSESENLNYASSVTECAVCLSSLEDEEMARLLPNCDHTFHAECIDKWLSSSSTCPICRAEAEPRLQLEPREAPVGCPSSSRIQERVNSMFSTSTERGAEYNNGDTQSPSSSKANGSTSRLSSFRRMLSREISSRRIHSRGQEEDTEDLERQ